MSKKEFLKKLSKALKKLVPSERSRYIGYYDEVISDMVDNGVSEEEAVAKQGGVEKIAEDILRDVDKEQLIRKDVPGTILSVLTIVLTIVSVVCMFVLPDEGAISLMKSDGPTSVFFTGEINEPIALYIITILLMIAVIIYFSLRHRLVGIVTFVVVLIAFCSVYFLRDTIMSAARGDDEQGIVAENDDNWVENKTEQIINLLNAEDYDTLCNEYASEEMKSYLTKDVMDEVKLYVSDDWGEFISNSNIYSSEIAQNGQLYTIVQVNSTYENVSVTYTITYNEDKELAGMYMK